MKMKKSGYIFMGLFCLSIMQICCGLESEEDSNIDKFAAEIFNIKEIHQLEYGFGNIQLKKEVDENGNIKLLLGFYKPEKENIVFELLDSNHAVCAYEEKYHWISSGHHIFIISINAGKQPKFLKIIDNTNPKEKSKEISILPVNVTIKDNNIIINNQLKADIEISEIYDNNNRLITDTNYLPIVIHPGSSANIFDGVKNHIICSAANKKGDYNGAYTFHLKYKTNISDNDYDGMGVLVDYSCKVNLNAENKKSEKLQKELKNKTAIVEEFNNTVQLKRNQTEEREKNIILLNDTLTNTLKNMSNNSGILEEFAKDNCVIKNTNDTLKMSAFHEEFESFVNSGIEDENNKDVIITSSTLRKIEQGCSQKNKKK
jgi:hypothetical protein